MTLKSLPAGMLFDYFVSARNYKGEPRAFAPRWLNGEPAAAVELLKRQAPPHVREDRRHRQLGHWRTHLTHLIVGFSEGFEAVRPFLPCVVAATERLVLAGLGPDCLDFAWCEHPQLENTHLHCAMTRAVLPAGGHYTLGLPGTLAACFARLLSWRLGLTNPFERDRARLVYAGEFSLKGANRKCIDLIGEAVREHFKNGNPDPAESCHESFLRLLRQKKSELGIGDIVVRPGSDGWPLCLADKLTGRLYRNSVAVEGPDSLIWLAGGICRHDFVEWSVWRESLQQREERFRDVVVVFGLLAHLLKKRLQKQRRLYGIAGSALRPVGLELLDFLDPAGRFGKRQGEALDRDEDFFGPGVALPKLLIPEPPARHPAPAGEFAWHLPEAACPYYSDLDLFHCRDVADPRNGEEIDFGDPADGGLAPSIQTDGKNECPQPARSEVAVPGRIEARGASVLAQPQPSPSADGAGEAAPTPAPGISPVTAPPRDQNPTPPATGAADPTVKPTARQPGPAAMNHHPVPSAELEMQKRRRKLRLALSIQAAMRREQLRWSKNPGIKPEAVAQTKATTVQAQRPVSPPSESPGRGMDMDMG